MAAILTSLGHSVSGFSAWLQIVCVFPGSSVNPFQSVIWCQSPRLCTHPLFCMSHMWNSTVVIHYWKNHCWFQMITRKLTHPIFCMSHMRLWLLLCIRIFLIWNTTVVIHYLKNTNIVDSKYVTQKLTKYPRYDCL